MKILVSITSGSNNTERNILRAFYDGIEKYYFSTLNIDTYKKLKKDHGIDLRLSYDPEIEKCDIAVQFGTVKERSAEHHITRQSIGKNSKTIIFIETPILGRTIVKNSDHPFYRVGVNGFLNNDGLFCNDESLDVNRLSFLKTQVEIPNFPGWKNPAEGNILILLQLPGDASLRGQKLSEWLLDTIRQLRILTKRRIAIRFHPAMSDKGRAEFFGEIGNILFENFEDIVWKDGIRTSLDEDLSESGVCISYSSGSCIDAVLRGVPCITTDEGNLAYPISSHRIPNVLNPKLATVPEIDHWLNCLANSQWSESEMLEGKVWKHILPLAQQSLDDQNDNSLS